jgi:hypothetical protein
MNCTIVASEAGISSPEPPMLPPRRWASRRAAAEHLACAERTPDQMVADGRITAYRFEGFAARRRRELREFGSWLSDHPELKGCGRKVRKGRVGSPTEILELTTTCRNKWLCPTCGYLVIGCLPF